MQPRQFRKRLVTKTITVPANLKQACDEFNSGRFYEAHESIEEIWQLESGPLRDLYKGLIQLAAAFVHLSRGKQSGAERLLRTSLGYLEPYRAEGAMGFDVESICRAERDVYQRLKQAGPAGVASMDLSRRPLMTFDERLLERESRRWQAWGFRDGLPLEMEITVAV
jgi:hypothetical protein